MLSMRTTLNLADDALLHAKRLARSERLTLGEAVSRLVSQGAQKQRATIQLLRGRFALLPKCEEVITPEHVRALMGCESC